jgi:hypothetical protein
MGWIGCVHCEKLWCDFVARTSSLIAPVQPILHRVPCSNETLPNAPKHYKMLQNMSLVPMGWIECVLCEKFWCDFMAQTCALIASVQPVLHRVSCNNETLTNALKHYKMLRNMSLVPMGWIEWVLCEKFRCDFRAQTCALIAPVQPVLHRVSCSNETLTNAPKHYENAPKHEFRVQWGGSRAFIAKNSDASSWHELLH